MIDLHCHLCFGVDDGPETAEESLKLAKALVKAGVSTVACTSHFRDDRAWYNDTAVQKVNHSNLDDALGEVGKKFSRVEGAEHYFDIGVPDMFQEGRGVFYSGTRWILLEPLYELMPPNLMAVVRELQAQKIKPLLAHVERFPYIHEDSGLMDDLLASGCAFQVNSGSFSNAYGKEYMRPAEKLMDEGFVHIIASDCHSAGDVKKNIIKGLKVLRKRIGDAGVQTLCVDNPRKLLGDCTQRELLSF